MNRVQIFIDGGNFYHLALKRINCHESEFDFNKFAIFLLGERKLSYPGKRFYIGTVRENGNSHETTKAMSNQTYLFNVLERNGWTIKTSKLRTRTETIQIDDRFKNYQEILDKGIKEITYQRSREKGIDVKLSTDLLIGAIDDRYDIAIVVSSDSDLKPAIDVIRKKFNKKVEYVGFSSPPLPELKIFEELKPTNIMIYSSDIQRIIPVSDLNPFKL
ncbi:MAG: NYN domain-containing protein [bacterium]